MLPRAVTAPLVAVLLLMQHWFIPHKFGDLVIHVAVGTFVYAIAFAWVFWTHRAWNIGHLGPSQEDELTFALVETYQEDA